MAPNSVFNDYFGEQLKGFHTSKKYTDVSIRIIEEVPGADADVQSCSSTLSHTTVVQCHKLVLHINSPYFEEVLDKEGNEVGEFDVKVKKGEARYLEILLSFFYDEIVINNLSLIDLICLLEVAVTYARDHHASAIVDLILKLDPDFESSTFGIQKLYSIEQGSSSNLSEKLKTSLKQKFTAFLAKYFVPLEENQEKHDLFLSLQYSSFLCILQSNEPLAMSENSIFMFIMEWLDYDESRQTSDAIQDLLSTLRIENLSGSFLHSGIGIDHRILSKWKGYNAWIFKALYQVMLPQGERKVVVNSKYACRTVGITAWFHNIMNTEAKLRAIRWSVHMTTVEKGKRLEPTRHFLVHDTMKFSPKSITISPIEGDNTKFNMSLQITSSYSMFGMRFVLGIVPADKEYDIMTKSFHSPFARSFLKWTDPVDTEESSKDFDFWEISEDLVKVSDEFGLYVLLLPLTHAEFVMLDKCHFGPKCDAGHLVRVVGKQVCANDFPHIHTYPGGKIHLNASSNFMI